jgi:DNA polymerase-3 subunit delta
MNLTPKEIIKQLKSGKYESIYFLMGTESFYIDEISNFIEESALDDSQKEFNQTILYGMDVKISDILTHARRFPMMSERQVLIVREAQSVSDINREGGQKLLLDYISNPLPSTILVFCHKNKTLDKRKSLYKALTKSSSVVMESAIIKEYKIPGWIKERIAEKGLKITEKAVMMLTQNIGSNLERINNEIEKVSINIKTKTIDDNAIQTYVGINRDYNIFELVNALGARNKVKAHEIAFYLGTHSKENPLVLIIGFVFSFFSKLLKLYGASGKTDKDLYSILGTSYISDYKVAAGSYSMTEVVLIISAIKRADLQSKGIESPSISQAGILKELVAKIVG